MRILVVGAGATGGYFGGRLALAGRDVTFLVRGARAETLRKEGLRLMTPEGEFSLRPQLTLAEDIKQPYDVIILTVKAFALESALLDITPAMGQDTLIMPMLNGMKHLDILTTRYGKSAVIGGMCKIAATLNSQGHVVRMSPLHELYYGELDGSTTQRIQTLDQQLSGAGFDTFLSTSIINDMWEKWLLLASLGAITCLMRGNIGQVASTVGGGQFAHGVINEVLAIITSAGYRRNEQYIAQTTALLTRTDSVQTSSMYRDLMQGYPVEAEQVLGDLVTIGHRVGLGSPLLNAAYTHLAVYQASRT
ncbi:ketopantoate reductase family protein [Acerihabitans sp. TG2]|uniref:ketopantoate reductase family protein n=1 Tax=Acerihabitans sp. TG2 TaxID=3096008 RepID=UPI002B23D166|nr:ketopantoate reductase family protein [Acerihabitans sp. TG2]MEA9391463.1 ketopantoate reductase family protein [Acerihabitans sp. TG2]